MKSIMFVLAILAMLITGTASAAIFGAGALTVSGSQANTQGSSVAAYNGIAGTRSGVVSASGGTAGVFLTKGGLQARQTTYNGTAGYSGSGAYGQAAAGSVYKGDAAGRSGAGWVLVLP